MIGLVAADRILEAQKVDIRWDKSRCLRSRYRHSTCTECVQACVNRAVKLESGKILRDEDLCKGCMQCVSSCPSDAFLWESGWHWTLINKVKNNSRPLLGCQKAISVDNHFCVPCISLFSEEVIISLLLSTEKPISIDLSNCDKCENKHTVPVFQQRLSNVTEKLDIVTTDRIYLLTEKDQIREIKRATGRRKFFGDFKNIIVPKNKPSKTSNLNVPSLYFSQKKQTIRSALLLFSAMQCASNIREKIFIHYLFSARVEDQCRLCGGCAAICPTGALKLKREGESKQLQFRMFNCNGCNLCQEFCKQKAISVTSGIEKESISSSTIQNQLVESKVEILNQSFKN